MSPWRTNIPRTQIKMGNKVYAIAYDSEMPPSAFHPNCEPQDVVTAILSRTAFKGDVIYSIRLS